MHKIVLPFISLLLFSCNTGPLDKRTEGGDSNSSALMGPQGSQVVSDDGSDGGKCCIYRAMFPDFNVWLLEKEIPRVCSDVNFEDEDVYGKPGISGGRSPRVAKKPPGEDGKCASPLNEVIPQRPHSCVVGCKYDNRRRTFYIGGDIEACPEGSVHDHETEAKACTKDGWDVPCVCVKPITFPEDETPLIDDIWNKILDDQGME